MSRRQTCADTTITDVICQALADNFERIPFSNEGGRPILARCRPEERGGRDWSKHLVIFNFAFILVAFGSGLAQANITFGPMNTHDSYFIVPPITEVPDYVWSSRYDKPSFLPDKSIKKPQDPGRKIIHPDDESALQAAKKSCRSYPGRWYGRSSSKADGAEFLVYEGIQVIERHVIAK